MCYVINIKQGDCKNGILNQNFKGFMVNNAQTNWNSMWTMYNFGDPSEPMVDREQIYFFHYSQSIMNWHTKQQIKLYKNANQHKELCYEYKNAHHSKKHMFSMQQYDVGGIH
jgi:hypothetical protein